MEHIDSILAETASLREDIEKSAENLVRVETAAADVKKQIEAVQQSADGGIQDIQRELQLVNSIRERLQPEATTSALQGVQPASSPGGSALVSQGELRLQAPAGQPAQGVLECQCQVQPLCQAPASSPGNVFACPQGLLTGVQPPGSVAWPLGGVATVPMSGPSGGQPPGAVVPAPAYGYAHGGLPPRMAQGEGGPLQPPGLLPTLVPLAGPPPSQLPPQPPHEGAYQSLVAASLSATTAPVRGSPGAAAPQGRDKRAHEADRPRSGKGTERKRPRGEG